MEHNVKLTLEEKTEEWKRSSISSSYARTFSILRKVKFGIMQAYHIAKVTVHGFHQKMYEFKYC
jgi:hypothetical protein